MTAKQAVNHDWKEGEAIWKIEYKNLSQFTCAKKPVKIVKGRVEKVDISHRRYFFTDDDEKVVVISIVFSDGEKDNLCASQVDYRNGTLRPFGMVSEYFLSDIMAGREFKRRLDDYNKRRESIIKNRIVQYEEQIKDHQNTISFLQRRKKELLKELRKDDS